MDDNQPDHSRYFDPSFRIHVVKVLPCQLYFTRQTDEMIATILGSCVSACVRDPVAQVAALNHFMLPETAQPRSADLIATLRYGNHSMDMLIEGLLARGARLERLEIKVFGGGNVTMGPGIGEENANWVLRYLEQRRLPIAARHLGGTNPRRLHYFPGTGLVLMRQLKSSMVNPVELQPNASGPQVRERNAATTAPSSR
ncbi:MAG TPA: chemoreceptor glutamine deamidase CheD [Patescibacteria group bacterium]|nr:chemoreceptor glutamine deamidase CheD [Patescibacteria group bacterium]